MYDKEQIELNDFLEADNNLMIGGSFTLNEIESEHDLNVEKNSLNEVTKTWDVLKSIFNKNAQILRLSKQLISFTMS